jgi:hypothetical protein
MAVSRWRFRAATSATRVIMSVPSLDKPLRVRRGSSRRRPW